jgi:hypothetical protein
LEGNIAMQVSFDGGDDQTSMLVEIGPARKTFWGMFQEFGTRFQKGIHWMSRAWESCQDRCLDVFATEATGLLMDLENKK